MTWRQLFWMQSACALFLAVPHYYAACSATSREPCTDADLAKVVARHEARLAAKCYGQGPDCDARERETAQFEAELKTWVRCDEEPIR